MTVLTYRGNKYPQQKEASQRETVELRYRANVYTSRQAEARKQIQISLCYRGIKYSK